MTSKVVNLESMAEQLDAANTRMTDGDWSLWRELLSSRDDVAILGAYGGTVAGQEALSARFGQTAGRYAGGGGRSTHEHIISWSGAACLQRYGRASRVAAGRQPRAGGVPVPSDPCVPPRECGLENRASPCRSTGPVRRATGEPWPRSTLSTGRTRNRMLRRQSTEGEQSNAQGT